MPKKREELIKNCRKCGTEFRTTHVAQQYCNEECGKDSKKDQQKIYYARQRMSQSGDAGSLNLTGNKALRDDVKQLLQKYGTTVSYGQARALEMMKKTEQNKS